VERDEHKGRGIERVRERGGDGERDQESGERTKIEREEMIKREIEKTK
jgi:hypothetical protein